jgi:hypothetical protein
MVSVYSTYEGRIIKRATREVSEGREHFHVQTVPPIGNGGVPLRYQEAPEHLQMGWWWTTRDEITDIPNIHYDPKLGDVLRYGLIDEFLLIPQSLIQPSEVAILFVHCANRKDIISHTEYDDLLDAYTLGREGWLAYRFAPRIVAQMLLGSSPHDSGLDEGEYAEYKNRKKFFTEY